MHKASLYTLGCKVSLYETEAIAEGLESHGFEIVPYDTPADICIINTCTVTAESDAKSRKYIRRAHRINPDCKIIVIGCYSQRSPDEVSAIEGVAYTLGTADKMKSVGIALGLLDGTIPTGGVSVGELSATPFEPMQVKSPRRTRGFVKIEDGCECKCTYCAIADARGPVRSKAPEDVLREVSHLYSSGILEVVLTGIETGSYGKDLGTSYGLGELMTDIDRLCPGIRVRLGSMAPELLTREFIDKVSALKCTVPHFHISMQSASSEVLRRMKRRYSAEKAIETIDYIKQKMPRVMLTADLMVGFPGESEENFLETVDFVARARLLSAHIFAYSKRHGTPAADYPEQVADAVKRERSARLQAKAREVQREVLGEVIERGEALSVIFETKEPCGYRGHSDSFIEVVAEFSEDVCGRLCTVVPKAECDGVIYGEIIKIDK